MKRLALAIGLSLAVHAHAWGPATHIHLAERATGSAHPELHFGSMLPDMNHMIFSNPSVFDAVRQLAHYECERVAPSWLGLGMISHNEAWGADWYSHQYWLPETPQNAGLYSTRKIRYLEQTLALEPYQAEFLFEFAIDFLLRIEEGPVMGQKLLASAAAFGPRQQQMLVDAFAAPLEERVAHISYEQAEKEIRQAAGLYLLATEAYGAAFVQDEAAVLDALTAMASFYLNLDFATADHHLGLAVELCRYDYRAELARISELLKADMAAHTTRTTASPAWGCAAPPDGSTHAALDPALGIMLALGGLGWARRRMRRLGRSSKPSRKECHVPLGL